MSVRFEYGLLLLICLGTASAATHKTAKTAPATPVVTPAPAAAATTAPAATKTPAPTPILAGVMPTKGPSGLPLPRFASLKTSPIDMRVGPGFRYPITWVYAKRDLPVQIIREYDVWRQVRDSDGTEGWVQELKLSGKRDFVITGATRDLHSTTEASSSVVARLEPGVVGHITSCAIGSDWCHVSVANVEGWLLRSDFFGTLPNETLP